MHYQIPKGLFDILPYTDEPWRLTSAWQHLEKVFHKVALDYGFQEIRTPIFEHTDLFARGVGATSDIVSKEMYTFRDKGERLLSLRPEGTSSVLRAFIENNLGSYGNIHKLYYVGPMFRYDRPQAGRYRQFHQVGAEVLGVPSAEQDAEIIDMLLEFFVRLGIKNTTIYINSIGDIESREAFRKAFHSFLTPFIPKLSKESQSRLEKNPLRILDSKDPEDQALLKNAPSILDFLSPLCKDHFQKLCSSLDRIHIPYQINPKIVRGLDYYNKTVFEIASSDLGAQNALGGGGRYDDFTSLFGGPPLPGTGFSAGMERILQTMLKQNLPLPTCKPIFVFLIPLGERAKEAAFSLTTQIRHLGIPAEIDLEVKKLQTSLQRANRLHACFAIIIGDREIETKILRLKNMHQCSEEEISWEHLTPLLQNKWKESHVQRM